MTENLLALPLGVVAAAAVAALWFLVTPLRDIAPAMLLPALPLLFAGLVGVHELIHALQRTRHDATVCNPCVPWAGSLSLVG